MIVNESSLGKQMVHVHGRHLSVQATHENRFACLCSRDIHSSRLGYLGHHLLRFKKRVLKPFQERFQMEVWKRRL